MKQDRHTKPSIILSSPPLTCLNVSLQEQSSAKATAHGYSFI